MTLPVPRTVLLQAELPEYVAETVADFVAFLLRLLAALVVLAVGWALGIVAAGTRMFLYFTAVVIGLGTMGIDVSILYVFAKAVS